MKTTSFYLYMAVFACALLSVSSSYAQDDTRHYEINSKSVPPKKYQITIAPSKFISRWSPSLELGFEYKLKNPRHALFYEVGFILASQNRTSSRNYTKTAYGFKAKPAYRFYINSDLNYPRKSYISVNYLFKYEDRYRKTSYTQPNSGIELNKIIITNGLLFNLGMKTQSKTSPLSFEFEGGVGFATKSVSYSNIPDNIISLAVYNFYKDPWLIEKRGSSTHLLLNFTIRVGYEFE